MKGIKNSLVSKLENVIKQLDKGNNNTAINKLNAFINEVNAQSGKKISTSDANLLIAYAEGIINLIPE